MKTIVSFIGIIAGAVVAQLLGYAVPILAVFNLLWLLVKDELLVSWWTVGYMAIAFIVSVFIALGSYIYLRLTID